jgi:peptidoglycan hydrolase-like protein with peptidoglycan-binding domain
MRALRLGHTGEDVEQWQHFLTGLGYDLGEVDGSFGSKTKVATEQFQRSRGLTADGVVGRETLSLAISMGFGDVEDDGVDDIESSSAWPPRPNFAPLSAIERSALFGNFAYKAAPVAGNPEAIIITDGWAKTHITMVEIPQLKRIKGAPASGKVPFHAKAAKQLQALWAAWEAAGLIPLIQTWAGSWVPRFIRGSRTYLSNHSWGTAFDINPEWNSLGVQPALVGQPGSVRKLVPLANEHGFTWGGHFGSPWVRGRSDGMHFEVAFLS